MRDDPKQVLSSILSNVDPLLEAARKHAASMKEAWEAKNDFDDSSVIHAVEAAKEARANLVQEVTDCEARRAEKVATVRSMLHIASRLLPA
jgi:hypothetical protein